jgi:hypothetical protein
MDGTTIDTSGISGTPDIRPALKEARYNRTIARLALEMHDEQDANEGLESSVRMRSVVIDQLKALLGGYVKQHTDAAVTLGPDGCVCPLCSEARRWLR